MFNSNNQALIHWKWDLVGPVGNESAANSQLPPGHYYLSFIHIAHTLRHSTFANSDPTENLTSGNLGKSLVFRLHYGVVIFLAALLPASIEL